MRKANKTDRLLNRNLTKWPGLLVTGETITPDQAAVILIRTMGWVSTNNHRFRDKFYEIADIKDAYDSYETFCKKHGVLPLQYLGNAQIASCWVGGPHGWCNWDGSIGCNTFNIGKWPSTLEVYDDWKLIAKTFPFLSLRCQLLNKEICEDEVESKAVVEFVVRNGRVSIREPKELLRQPYSDLKPMSLLELEHETGCSIEQAAKALKLTVASLKTKRK